MRACVSAYLYIKACTRACVFNPCTFGKIARNRRVSVTRSCQGGQYVQALRSRSASIRSFVPRAICERKLQSAQSPVQVANFGVPRGSGRNSWQPPAWGWSKTGQSPRPVYDVTKRFAKGVLSASEIFFNAAWPSNLSRDFSVLNEPLREGTVREIVYPSEIELREVEMEKSTRRTTIARSCWFFHRDGPLRSGRMSECSRAALACVPFELRLRSSFTYLVNCEFIMRENCNVNRCYNVIYYMYVRAWSISIIRWSHEEITREESSLISRLLDTYGRNMLKSRMQWNNNACLTWNLPLELPGNARF